MYRLNILGQRNASTVSVVPRAEINYHKRKDEEGKNSARSEPSWHCMHHDKVKEQKHLHLINFRI